MLCKVLHSYKMLIKQKLLNAIAAHPKLAAFGIALAITMAVGTAIGMSDIHTAAAKIEGNDILVMPGR
jgi:hypothetical protein